MRGNFFVHLESFGSPLLTSLAKGVQSRQIVNLNIFTPDLMLLTFYINLLSPDGIHCEKKYKNYNYSLFQATTIRFWGYSYPNYLVIFSFGKINIKI